MKCYICDCAKKHTSNKKLYFEQATHTFKYWWPYQKTFTPYEHEHIN